MSWYQSLAALSAGGWRAGAPTGYALQRKWGLEMQRRQVASGAQRFRQTQSRSTGPTFSVQSKAPTPKASFPEKIEFSAPWSTTQPTPSASTQGDILGSFGATIGNAPSYLNLANVVPWAMERPLVGIDEAAKALTSDDDNIVSQGINMLGGLVENVAKPIAGVMEAPLNWYRDSSIGDRAKVYRLLVNRQRPGFEQMLMTGTLFSGGDARQYASQLDSLLAVLGQNIDGDTRRKAEDSLRILADAIDIPDEMKREISSNPDISDDEINRAYDRIGRQFSYKGGLIENMALPMVYYGAMAVGGYRMAGVASKAAAGTGPVSSAIRYGAWAARPIVTVQKYAMAAGLGYLGASVIGETVLRTLGNEEGVAVLDRLNRSTVFSDDPAVQLVTSFSVDPIRAAKITLRTGAIPLRYGKGIVVGKANAKRAVDLFNDDARLFDRLGKVYGLDADAARALVGPEGFATKAEAWETLVRLSADSLTAKDSPYRLVGAERWATEVANSDRTRAFLQTNFNKVLDLIDNHPEALASRLRRDWGESRNMPGEFNPWQQVRIDHDYNLYAEMTERARAEVDAVLGLPGVLHPRAQELARTYLDDLFTEGVETATLRDLQDFLRRFPAMRDQWTGMGTWVKAEEAVGRDTFEELLKRASQAYDDLLRRNPVRAKMGRDPVLRPNSTTYERDLADALGSSPETVTAIGKSPAAWSAADRDLMGAFARDKGIADRTLPDEELFGKVNDYVAQTTEPWVRRGAEVESVESRLAIVDGEIESIRRMHAGAPPHGAIAPKLAERAQLLNLISDALEPQLMFTQAVKFARPAAAARREVERAGRILAVQERMGRIRAVIEAAQSFDWPSVPTQPGRAATRTAAALPAKERPEGLLSLLTDVGNGHYVWSGGRPQVPQNILTRNGRYWFERGASEKAVAYEPGVTIPRMWQRLWEHAQGDGRRAYTPQQLRMIERYGQGGENLDEWAAAWSKAGNEGEFIEWLTGLRREYDDALAGGRLTDLLRTEKARMPEWAEAEAKAAQDVLWNDPEVVVRQTLARGEIKRALSNDDMFPVASELIEKDPDLLGQIEQSINRRQPVEPLRTVQAMGEGRRPIGFDQAVNGAFEPGYVYRGVQRSTIEAVAREGVTPTPDFAVGEIGRPASYWSDSITEAGRYNDTLLRTPRSAAPAERLLNTKQAATDAAYAEMKQTEHLIPEAVPPGSVEYLGTDYGWHPVADLTAQRNVYDYIRDPANREAMLALMPDEPGVIPGVPAAVTELDQALIAGDEAAATAFRQQLDDLKGRIAEPVRNVSPEAAEAIIRAGRPSTNLAREVGEAGLSRYDVLSADAWVGRDIAAKAASFVENGSFTRPPRTIGALIRVLREIENGNVANAGMGPQLAAELQRGIREVVAAEVKRSRAAMFEKGVIGHGKGLNIDTWGQDTFDTIRTLFGKEGHGGLIVTDENGMLTYGLKARPKEAVVIDMSTVPGLVEELMTGRYAPFDVRVGNAHLRQTWNALFGPLNNQRIFFDSAVRFSDRLAARGIPLKVSQAIWKEFGETARRSQELIIRKSGRFGAPIAIEGGNPLYASVKNIPNANLHDIAQRVAREKLGADFTPEMATIRFDDVFREATSDVRRVLADKVPKMGEYLAKAYGVAMHNKWVTTHYYWFRFALDMRFRAMEAIEGPALYYGRSGLMRREINEGMFGADRASIASRSTDAMMNTGYPFSATRDGWLYRSMLKEQPAKLRGLVAEDPAAFERAVRQLADIDPELSRTIALMGDTPDDWLKALDSYWTKLLDSTDPATVARGEVMKQLGDHPELAEVYGRIADANAELVADLRSVFYGNPNRSRIERIANSYLLYWPISYQIKASKWLLRIMFDRAGGIKTNAAGAWGMDQIAQTHARLLEEDGEYARWIEEHPTLVFAAQMLVPISPTQVGVSLSPAIRDLLFGRTKAVMDIGPVYTFNTLLPRMAGELYPDLAGVPGMDRLYPMVAGRKPPKVKAEDDLWQPDPLRWGS